MTKLLTAAIRSEQIKGYKSVGEAWKASSQNPEDICNKIFSERWLYQILMSSLSGSNKALDHNWKSQWSEQPSKCYRIDNYYFPVQCSCYTYDIWRGCVAHLPKRHWPVTIISYVDQGSTVRQQLRTKSFMPRVILVLYFIIKVHYWPLIKLQNPQILYCCRQQLSIIVVDKTAGSAKRLKCPAVIKVGGEKDLIGHRCNGNWPFLTCPPLFL